MSAASEVKGNKSNVRRALYVLIPLLVIGGGVSGYLAYGSISGATSIVPKSGTNAVAQTTVEFSVAITHQNEKFADVAWLTQMAMKGQFWSASCYAFCNGVTYKLDPTITTQGVDWLQCKLFGADTTIGSTCSSPVSTTDVATVIGVSATSATGVGDTYSSGSCDSTNVAVGNGFNPATATTLTTPAAASGSVTTTAAVTFTATGTASGLTTACLLTELTSGSHPYVVADGTFGPDTLSSGNTLTITWQITTS